MLAVGIDTSVPRGSVGLAGEGIDPGGSTLPVSAAYSETLLPALEQLLARAGRTLRDVDLFAVASGPGTFTGLRIGMATAKGLALALGKPLAGLSNLETVARVCAAGAGTDAVVCVLQDAGRGELYRGVYVTRGSDLDRLIPEGIVPPGRALEGFPGPAILCGDHASPALSALPGRGRGQDTWRSRPDIGGALACRVLELARRRGVAGLPPPVPNYLRPSDAEVGHKG